MRGNLTLLYTVQHLDDTRSLNKAMIQRSNVTEELNPRLSPEAKTSVSERKREELDESYPIPRSYFKESFHFPLRVVTTDNLSLLQLFY